MKGSQVTENQNSNMSESLTEAIQGFGNAIENMSKTLKSARASGMSDIDIRDSILLSIPEEDRPAFLQQWPMISMMFAML
jgi:hypothetical protein